MGHRPSNSILTISKKIEYKREITEATLRNFVESDELRFIGKAVQSTTWD